MDDPMDGKGPVESDAPDGSGSTDNDVQDQRLSYFLELLSDDESLNRWKAAGLLGRQKDPRAVETLIDTLWDDDSRVRLKAAWALGQIGDQRAMMPLQRLYRMETEDARDIIKEALEEIKRRARTG
jgi:HEAT repeat protein